MRAGLRHSATFCAAQVAPDPTPDRCPFDVRLPTPHPAMWSSTIDIADAMIGITGSILAPHSVWSTVCHGSVTDAPRHAGRIRNTVTSRSVEPCDPCYGCHGCFGL